MGTFSPTPKDIERNWYVIDMAKLSPDLTLGRVASLTAHYLRGKHKPTYAPHMDMGDNMVVINIKKLNFKGGNKGEQKQYYRHSGYPGGLKSVSLNRLMETNPVAVFESAVQGMLPKGPLGRQMFKKLKMYAGDEHPHSAQNPQPLDVEKILS